MVALFTAKAYNCSCKAMVWEPKRNTKSNTLKENLMTDKVKKYTADDEARMRVMVAEGNSLADIAASFTPAKTVRQVRSKLVLMGLYHAQPKDAAAPKVEGPAKKELLKVLEGMGFDPKAFEGARKDGLAALIDRVNAKAAA